MDYNGKYEEGSGWFPSGIVFHSGESNGYSYKVIMGPITVNGYLELPEDHSWTHIDDSWSIPWNVHGGVTYRKGNVIGFDTNHYGDGDHPDSQRYKDMTEAGYGHLLSDGKVWSPYDVLTEISLSLDPVDLADSYDKESY